MTWLVVAVGLAAPRLPARARATSSSRSLVGMRPRSFYVGFPPALVKVQAQRDRVRASARSRSAATCASPACTGRPGGTSTAFMARALREDAGARRRSCSACGARSTPRTSTAHAPRCPSSSRDRARRADRRRARARRTARCASSTRAPAPTRTGGRRLEARRRHRRRPGREHRRRVRHLLRGLRDRRAVADADARRSDTVEREHAGRRSRAAAPATGSSPSTACARRRSTHVSKRDPREPRASRSRSPSSRDGRTRHARPAADDRRCGDRWIWGFVPRRARLVPARHEPRARRRASAGASSPATVSGFAGIFHAKDRDADLEPGRHRAHVARRRSRPGFSCYLRAARR